MSTPPSGLKCLSLAVRSVSPLDTALAPMRASAIRTDALWKYDSTKNMARVLISSVMGNTRAFQALRVFRSAFNSALLLKPSTSLPTELPTQRRERRARNELRQVVNRRIASGGEHRRLS